MFIGIVIGIFVAIKQMKKASDKIDELSDSVKKFQTSLDPVIAKTTTFLDTANSITKKVDENMSILSTTTESLKTVADNIVEFEEKLRSKIEPPVMDTITSYTAIVKGVKTFVEKFRAYRSEDKTTYDDEYDYEYEEGSNESDEIIYDTKIYKEVEDLNSELNEVRKKIEELKK